MLVYSVVVLVLIGIILVVAAFWDRRRGREIERDPSRDLRRPPRRGPSR